MNKKRQILRSKTKTNLIQQRSFPIDTPLKMNNRSQLANILLPLASLALVAASLYTLLTFSNAFSSNDADINSMIQELNFNEKYVLAQTELLVKKTLSSCLNCSPENFKSKLKEESLRAENLFRFEGSGNLYGKIRNSEFYVEKSEEQFMVKIPGLFVFSERGFNKLTRNFDLCLLISENEILPCPQSL